MNRVTVFSLAPTLADDVQSLLPDVEVIKISPDNKESLMYLNTAIILIADCFLLARHPEQLNKNVKWIQSTSAGVEPLMIFNDRKKYNFTATRFYNESYSLEMAEYVVAQIILHERNQFKEYEMQKRKEWSSYGMFTSRRLIGDLTIGVLGLGNIGKVVAKSLKNFGATVWGLTRSPLKEKLDFIDVHRTVDHLPEFLANCDYVINVLPITKMTVGLLNGEMLKNCQDRGTIFINVGRGQIIREDDLVHALENKWISAAILDVFEVEPLPQSSKLWSMPQVTITPHNACSVRPKNIAELFAKNFEKFIRNEPLPHTVDFERGY